MSTEGTTLPSAVLERERQYVTSRREAAGVTADQPVVGLSLSGGGIRSATFSLGVLQALAELKLLPLVDYLCTVSGGGYIGACLTSYLTLFPPRCEPRRLRRRPVVDAIQAERLRQFEWKKKQGFGVTPETMPFLRKEPVHHLRKYGSFLVTNGGLFHREVLRAVGSVTAGLVVTWALFAACLAAAVGLLFVYGSAFAPDGKLWPVVASAQKVELGTVLDAIRSTSKAAAAAFLVGGAAAVVGAVLSYTTRDRGVWPIPGETTAGRRERRSLKRYAMAVVPLILVGTQLVAQRASPTANAPSWPGLALPCVAFLGATFLAILLYLGLTFPPRSTLWTRTYRSVVGGMIGVGLYGLIAMSALVTVILTAWWLGGRALGPTLWAGLSLIVTRALALRGQAGEAAGIVASLKRVLPSLALNLAVPVFLFSAVLVGTVLALPWEAWRGLPLVGVGAAGLVLAGMLVNYNRISPHYFYRDRLTDAYLQTEVKVDPPATTPQPDELVWEVRRDDQDMRLTDLHRNEDGQRIEPTDRPPINPAPFHLIQCALNLPGSRDLARRNRKSDHFVFSREFVGSTTTGYIPTAMYRQGTVELARALTISGAAAASAMGFQTSFARAFALTLFNIRLGYWMPNPDRFDRVVSPEWRVDGAAPNRKVRPPRGGRPWFWPRYLLKELTASADASAPSVNLSDGGHTGDNLGLYPLLQRRCKLILVCDGECDPRYSFGSFAAVIRQIQTDEDVRVDMDLDAIRPDPDGGARARGHFAVGKIVYPESPKEPGWLLYLKSSFTGSGEPAPVKTYAAENTEFPHQTTLDQFFSDAQFEAYRVLGKHVAETALAAVKGKSAHEVETWAAPLHK